MQPAMNTARFGRILIVDDTTANLQLLTHLLTEHGYTVYPASDGELALEFVRSILPDLILLDIRMPGLDGYEVCRRLKADERTRSIPIIFISILENEGDKVKGFQEGAVDYITKPFQPEEVLARVGTHLRLRELTEHLEQKVVERTEELRAANARLQAEITERKRMEASLRESEARLTEAQRIGRIGNWEWNFAENTLWWSAETYRIFDIKPQEFGATFDSFINMVHPEDRERVQTAIRDSLQNDTGAWRIDYRIALADGSVRFVHEEAETLFDQDGRPLKRLGVVHDITERKQAEQERLAHLRFFEGMDRINLAIQGANNLEEMMRDVLTAAYSIFKCDQLFLLYPCNPSAPTFRVVAEVCNPEYPGASCLNTEIPVKPAQAEMFGRILEGEIPVVMMNPAGQWVGSDAPRPDDHDLVVPQSALVMALRPKTGDSWMFGLHQCSAPRVWTPEEERFFQEIGRRLGDALTTLLMFRDLQESERRYRMVFENSPVSIWEEDYSGVKALLDDLKKMGIADIEAYLRQHPQTVRQCADLTKIVDVNRAALTLHAAENKEDLLRGLVDTFTPESFDAFRQELVWVWKGETEKTIDTSVKTLAGEHRDVTVYFSICPGYEETLAKVLVSLVDITGRKEAEREREKLQEQFIQAQKMESVGRLAGGVAHDFNNKLGVIMGYTDMVLNSTDQDQPLFKYLMEIRKATESSANLTRQLLAFARKQTISPVALDLNQTVESMLKMLRRLIGEDISLVWMPGAELWPVNMDPTQIDQILANLCVNARDAIAGVGKVTIQTLNIAFDEQYCAVHADAAPGEYVQLAVSDSGCGMDRETLNRLFEPFFTTKGVGKGTGLGLATVYGIVRQNNGFINVYSEPGYGATFRIYLPRHAVRPEQIRGERSVAPTARGRETILVVEDDAAILDLVKIVLESLGYLVLAASTPGEALRLAKEHGGEIRLLLTDVIMPEMTGLDLANQLTILYPTLRLLFMSGYTGNIIAHHGVLDENVNFIQKPFSSQGLAAKVREILDREAGN
jgi:DNA-binding response OmpR family regulator/signal transduction histidine kinase